MLKNTLINLFKDFGERPTLYKNFEEINSDLQFAYKYVGKIAKNKSILDFGCGGGYGTQYLSRFTAKRVIGYDINEFAVSSANQFFSQSKNLHFQSILPSQKFDLIVSFQVVEHISSQQLKTYFNSIISHLNPGGKVFFATPNKLITSYKLKTPIFAFHTIEYTPKTFYKLLHSYFKKVTISGQISQPTAKLVKAGKFSYDDLSTLNFKYQAIRFLSQIKPIRYLTGRVPQGLKNLVLGQTKIDKTPQLISADKQLLNNSYILIAECS